MPLIYQGRCTACGATTPTLCCYQAVFLDEPSESRHAHPDDRRLVVLPHPVEDLAIEEIGHTFPSASLAGRLVRVEPAFCKSCGRLYEVRRVTAGLASSLGCAGCLACLAACGTAGTAVGLSVGGPTGFVAGYLLTLGLLAAVDGLIEAGGGGTPAGRGRSRRRPAARAAGVRSAPGSGPSGVRCRAWRAGRGRCGSGPLRGHRDRACVLSRYSRRFRQGGVSCHESWRGSRHASCCGRVRRPGPLTR